MRTWHVYILNSIFGLEFVVTFGSCLVVLDFEKDVFTNYTSKAHNDRK